MRCVNMAIALLLLLFNNNIKSKKEIQMPPMSPTNSETNPAKIISQLNPSDSVKGLIVSIGKLEKELKSVYAELPSEQKGMIKNHNHLLRALNLLINSFDKSFVVSFRLAELGQTLVSQIDINRHHIDRTGFLPKQKPLQPPQQPNQQQPTFQKPQPKQIINPSDKAVKTFSKNQ